VCATPSVPTGAGNGLGQDESTAKTGVVDEAASLSGPQLATARIDAVSTPPPMQTYVLGFIVFLLRVAFFYSCPVLVVFNSDDFIFARAVLTPLYLTTGSAQKVNARLSLGVVRVKPNY
jgi:hypothetical protein